MNGKLKFYDCELLYLNSKRNKKFKELLKNLIKNDIINSQ